jgi:YgiT-type zinc finger domain-containing protein
MGETQPGLVTVTLQRGNTVVIIKEVPAHVCQNSDDIIWMNRWLSASMRRLTMRRSGMQRLRWFSMRREVGFQVH